MVRRCLGWKVVFPSSVELGLTAQEKGRLVMKGELYQMLISLSVLMYCPLLTMDDKNKVEDLMNALRRAIVRGADH